MTSIFKSLVLWIDTKSIQPTAHKNRIDLIRFTPFIFTHLVCLGIFFVPFNVECFYILALTYALRVFALTAFYHRCFSHRAFKTSRVVQFIFAFIATSSAQRGPLWWSAHHRHHHKYADTPLDRHSPHIKGFFWSHCGWFLLAENFTTDETNIKDLTKFTELRFLDRFDSLPPLILCLALYFCGGFLYVFWGYFVSTVLIYHVTFAINSIAHKIGNRDFMTKDQSRNNWLLAILSFGEGWHNNHHHDPSSARQGRTLLQLDLTYLILKLMEKINLVWDIRNPQEKYQASLAPSNLS